jgi:peroxiredoxin
MEAYRDQYATLFNNGRNVVVIGISSDADTTLASWARQSDFPVVMASDRGGAVQGSYGSYDTGRLDTRAVFVIGPDGRVAHVIERFAPVSAAAYTELAEAVDKVSPPPPGDANR